MLIILQLPPRPVRTPWWLGTFYFPNVIPLSQNASLPSVAVRGVVPVAAIVLAGAYRDYRGAIT